MVNVQPTLHPDFAAVQAKYMKAKQDFTAGVISAAEAETIIRSLVVADDQGAYWVLDRSGVWYRRQMDGSLVKDAPPASGVPSISPHQVSSPSSGVWDPRSSIMVAADQGSVAADGSGATSVLPRPEVAYEPSLWRQRVVTAAIVVIVAVILLLVL